MTVAKHKLIAPRNPTPTPSMPASPELTTSQASQLVPEDMLSEQVQRLSLLTAVGASLWGVGLLMHLFFVGHSFGPPVPRWTILIEALGVAFSLAEFCYLRFVPHAACTKADASLGYMVVNAIAVAMANTFAHPPTADMMGHLSWNVVVILVCAMIVPTSPRKMLVASLISASTDPIAVWLAHLRGVPTPSPLVTLVLFVPNYSCAVVAVLPAYMMHRFGRRLREAREMGSY